MSKNLERFEQLSYAALALLVVGIGVQYESFGAELKEIGVSPFIQALMLFALIGLTGLMIWLVARRRKNWARWLWVIMFAINIPSKVKNLGQFFTENAVGGGILGVIFLLQAAAIYLLFSGDAPQAFAKRASESDPAFPPSPETQSPNAETSPTTPA